MLNSWFRGFRYHFVGPLHSWISVTNCNFLCLFHSFPTQKNILSWFWSLSDWNWQSWPLTSCETDFHPLHCWLNITNFNFLCLFHSFWTQMKILSCFWSWSDWNWQSWLSSMLLVHSWHRVINCNFLCLFLSFPTQLFMYIKSYGVSLREEVDLLSSILITAQASRRISTWGPQDELFMPISFIEYALLVIK